MSGPATDQASWLVRLLVLPVRGYQRWISPATGQHCRFAPSCSSYAIAALELHGPLRGSGLTVRRLLRCHPWNRGGHDPVPDPLPLPGGASTTIDR